MAFSLDKPIVVGEGEGLDNVIETPTETPHSPIGTMRAIMSVNTLPVYTIGSRSDRPATDPQIYPQGVMGGPVEADKNIYTLEHVNDRLFRADGLLRGLGDKESLQVVSGFMTPKQKQKVWQAVYQLLFDDFCKTHGGRRPTPKERVALGRLADTSGSWADLQEPNDFGAHPNYRPDALLGFDPADRSDLIRTDANIGDLDVPLNIATARTIHSVGASVNVVLADSQGKPKNMGVGLDTPNALVQRVDFFEGNNVDAYVDAVERDPGLQRYLAMFGVEVGNRRSVEDAFGVVRDNRRHLHNAMTGAGFKEYYGPEEGHYSGELIGPWNRDDAFAQMRALQNPAEV
jgi:D-alanyl-D-alanine dipeptidase